MVFKLTKFSQILIQIKRFLLKFNLWIKLVNELNFSIINEFRTILNKIEAITKSI